MERPIRVLIADDHPIVREGLATVLSEDDSLDVVGRFGRQGRYAGQFHHVHSIAVDSSGNIYTAETQGKRVQKFLFEGLRSD